VCSQSWLPCIFILPIHVFYIWLIVVDRKFTSWTLLVVLKYCHLYYACSAYSIFNEDFRELPGTLNADRFDRDIRAGQFWALSLSSSKHWWLLTRCISSQSRGAIDYPKKEFKSTVTFQQCCILAQPINQWSDKFSVQFWHFFN